MGKMKDEYPALHKGLNQIPTRDLHRLRKALRDKDSPLVFDGSIFGLQRKTY